MLGALRVYAPRATLLTAERARNDCVVAVWAVVNAKRVFVQDDLVLTICAILVYHIRVL